MKKLIITLSIILSILLSNVIISSTTYAADSTNNTSTTTINSIKQIQMTLTSAKTLNNGKTILTFTDETQRKGYKIFTDNSTDKSNINKTYTITMQGDKILDYTLLCKYDEVITYVISSIYNPIIKQYMNDCIDENDEVYQFYSDKSLLNDWQVLIVDTKGNDNIKDDIVVNSYNLDGYVFNDEENY